MLASSNRCHPKMLGPCNDDYLLPHEVNLALKLAFKIDFCERNMDCMVWKIVKILFLFAVSNYANCSNCDCILVRGCCEQFR